MGREGGMEFKDDGGLMVSTSDSCWSSQALFPRMGVSEFAFHLF